MPPAARILDMHVCPQVTPALIPVPHVGGPITIGMPTVLIGGMPAARVGDMCTCVGPPDMISQGSPTVLIGGMPAARMGDMTLHGGNVIMGCPTVMIGDAGSGGGGGGGGAGGAGGGGGPPGAVVQAHSTGSSATIEAVPASQAGPLAPSEQEQEKTWIGIRLEDSEGNPIPNEDFQVTLEGGQVLSGTTDEEGYCRFEDIDPDQGEVAFTRIPQREGESDSGDVVQQENGDSQRPAGQPDDEVRTQQPEPEFGQESTQIDFGDSTQRED